MFSFTYIILIFWITFVWKVLSQRVFDFSDITEKRKRTKKKKNLWLKEAKEGHASKTCKICLVPIAYKISFQSAFFGGFPVNQARIVSWHYFMRFLFSDFSGLFVSCLDFSHFMFCFSQDRKGGRENFVSVVDF